MKVVLTYEQDGIGRAEQTVDVEDAVARRLLREGNARPTPQKQAAEARATEKES